MIVALLSIPALAGLQGEPHPRATVPVAFNKGLGYDQPIDQVPSSSSYYLTWRAHAAPATR
jgi:hypothetical protein